MKAVYVSVSLILLFVLLVSGCMREENLKQQKCEDFAIEMVPDKITLIEEDPAAVYPASILSYSGEKFWNDGKGLDKEYYAFRKDQPPPPPASIA